MSGTMDLVLSNTFWNILLVPFWKVIVFVNKRIVLKLSRFHILATIIPYSSVKCMLFFINNYCIQQDSFSFLNRKEQA